MNEYKVHLSDNQINKMRQCYNKREGCSLRIDLTSPKNKTLKLTQNQILQIESAKNQKKKTCDIKLNSTQLGGILPFLIPAAIAAAKALALGGVGALGAKAIQKITSGKGIRLPGKKY